MPGLTQDEINTLGKLNLIFHDAGLMSAEQVMAPIGANREENTRS